VLAQLRQLEAGFLGKAFRGELVPQDPNDEPASVLLDRIRAERELARQPNGKRSNGKNPPEAARRGRRSKRTPATAED